MVFYPIARTDGKMAVNPFSSLSLFFSLLLSSSLFFSLLLLSSSSSNSLILILGHCCGGSKGVKRLCSAVLYSLIVKMKHKGDSLLKRRDGKLTNHIPRNIKKINVLYRIFLKTEKREEKNARKKIRGAKKAQSVTALSARRHFHIHCDGRGATEGDERQ